MLPSNLIPLHQWCDSVSCADTGFEAAQHDSPEMTHACQQQLQPHLLQQLHQELLCTVGAQPSLGDTTQQLLLLNHHTLSRAQSIMKGRRTLALSLPKPSHSDQKPDQPQLQSPGSEPGPQHLSSADGRSSANLVSGRGVSSHHCHAQAPLRPALVTDLMSLPCFAQAMPQLDSEAANVPVEVCVHLSHELLLLCGSLATNIVLAGVSRVPSTC